MYIYDGSFDSLIHVCGELLGKGIVPEDICTEDSAAELLFGDRIHLSCNAIHGQKEGAVEKYSPSLYSYLCAAYLSEADRFEMTLFNFLSAVKERGIQVVENLSDERVLAAHRLSQKVYCERHRMLGLLRFSELSDGTYYAPFEPDHNIAGLVAPHFARRLAKQNWIIHDVSRGIGAIYRMDSRRWSLFDVDESSPLRYSEQELEYRKIWKRYYKEIAIPERKNPSCQKRFMPARYWKYLTERQ